MEPLSCVADVRDGKWVIWAAPQNPQDVQGYVRERVGVPTEVNVSLVGGGFGRRLEVDFALEAAEVSKAIGAPVQVVWSRDDDIKHDYYRPPSLHRMRAAWDAAKSLTMWRHQVAGPGLNVVVYKVGEELLRDGP